ncbi:hypothetical protein LPJ61_007081, partial [Coemansia biformis]
MADTGVLVAYAAIGAMALAPIYTGSYASLSRLASSKKRNKAQFAEYSDSEDEDDESESL